MPTSIIPIPKARDAAGRVNQPVRVDPGETPTWISNPSNITIYYKSTDTVSDTSNDGTLTQNQTLGLTTTEYLLGAERTEVVLNTSSAPPRSARADILTTAQGMLTQNFDRQNSVNAQIMIDGTAYFMSVGLRAGDLVSNITIAVLTAGTAVTLSKVGLYNKAGTQLAVSADQGTNWQSGGIKTVPMVTPYAVPAEDGYYVAVISKASTTLPTLQRGISSGVINNVVGTGMAAYGTQTAQTDLPASATIAVGGSPAAYWVGLS